MMLLNKIMTFNKVLILGFIISNCNSTEHNINLKYNSNKLNNIYSHDALKRFYKRELEEIPNSISNYSDKEPKYDLITQLKNSQNQLIEVVNEVINKINSTKNNMIQSLENSNNKLQKNIIKSTGMRYIIDLIHSLPNEFHDSITNSIITLINSSTKEIISNNQNNIINNADDTLCSRICNEITKLLKSKKKNPGILKNKFHNRKDRQLVICSENSINILPNSKKNKKKKKEIINYDAIFDYEWTKSQDYKNLSPKKHRIKVKRKGQNETITNENDTLCSRLNSFNTINSTQEQSQIPINNSLLDENTTEQLKQILKTNNNLYKNINEIKLLLELNQNEIISKLNMYNDTYIDFAEHIKKQKQLIIDAINKSIKDTINSVQNDICSKIDKSKNLIIDSCNNTINKNYEQCFYTINTSKPVISEIINNVIDNKVLPTINTIDMKYNEIINNYKNIYEENTNIIIQDSKAQKDVIQEVKTELQNINNNIKNSTEKVLLSLSYFGKDNNIASNKFKSLFNFFRKGKS